LADILTRFLKAPNKNNKTTSRKTLLATASKEIITANIAVETVIIFMDEYLAISQLDTGNAATKPAEIANSTAPNSAFERWSCCCISGIRDAQVEVIIPERKKKAAVVHLILFLTSITVQNVTLSAKKRQLGVPCASWCPLWPKKLVTKNTK